MALFDIFNEWAGKSKYIFWPTQTALLLLAPDALSKLGSAPDSTMDQFVDNLSLKKNPKALDYLIICFRDICKAATYVSDTDASKSPLRKWAANVEPDLVKKKKKK